MTRSDAKQDAVLDAARELFLARGYNGTSMDAVAATSGVSKQTVYNHFGDKKTLFERLLTRDMARADEDIDSPTAKVVWSENLEEDLAELARSHLRAVLQPHLLRLRRLVIGEAERFPHLAAAWHRNGPEQTYETFTELFTQLVARGRLKITTPRIAAEQFNWLVLSVPLNRALAYVDETMPPAESEIDTIARSAVEVFLAAYKSE